jgi:hypothetical protein
MALLLAGLLAATTAGGDRTTASPQPSSPTTFMISVAPSATEVEKYAASQLQQLLGPMAAEEGQQTGHGSGSGRVTPADNSSRRQHVVVGYDASRASGVHVGALQGLGVSVNPHIRIRGFHM